MKNIEKVKSIIAILVLVLLGTFVYIVLKNDLKEELIIIDTGKTSFGIITKIKYSKRSIYYFYKFKVNIKYYYNVSSAPYEFHEVNKVNISDSLKVMYLKEDPNKNLILYDTSFIRINYNKFHY
jgi:hypothetical protein